jgi:ATP-dependent exoDNAse (exonuclease V) beta subunit
MTLHAAKGLEFPIVFIVNLHMGGKGQGRITVIERDSRGEPHVAFGSNEETKLEEERNREELRRLLYVGVTRARDRLYFSGDLDRQGAFTKRGPSLAALLPPALLHQFSEAATAGRDEVEWASGPETFAFRVCRAPAEAAAATAAATPAADAQAPPLDLAPLVPAPPVVASASGEKDSGSHAGSDVGFQRSDPRRDSRGPDSRSLDPRLVGTIVHRLLQRRVDPGRALADLQAAARATVSFAELADVDDPLAVAEAAVALFRALADRPDVRALLDTGLCHYEVPFSYRPPDRPDVLIRGAVDCLVERPDGRLVVLEFKTGEPRPEHQAQANLYVEALGQALGSTAISAQIVYP